MSIMKFARACYASSTDNRNTDANQFKEAFTKAQEENEKLFSQSGETQAPAAE